MRVHWSLTTTTNSELQIKYRKPQSSNNIQCARLSNILRQSAFGHFHGVRCVVSSAIQSARDGRWRRRFAAAREMCMTISQRCIAIFPWQNKHSKNWYKFQTFKCAWRAQAKAWARVQPNSTWIQQTRKLPHEDNTQTTYKICWSNWTSKDRHRIRHIDEKAGSRDRRRRHAARRPTTYARWAASNPNGSQAGACIVLALHSRVTSRVITKMHSHTRTFAEVRHTTQEMACQMPLTQYLS